jgi:L-amino acid N-acyltransferase YncA
LGKALKIAGVKFTIGTMRASDWEMVRTIYLEGIATGNATFEIEAPDWHAWNTAHLPFCRLVARDDNSVLAWAALSPISSRCVYSGVAEVSIYVAASARGRGIGRALLLKLIQESELNGIWTLQAGILQENISSLTLHKGCGFREVGRRERIGKLSGVWRNVILLELRSRSVGLD